MDSLTAPDFTRAGNAFNSLGAVAEWSVRSQSSHPLIEATVTAAPLTASGLDEYCFLVTPSDWAVIDLANLGMGEVLVTGPHDYCQPATFAGLEENAILYQVKAPNGAWCQADNGVYQIGVVVDKAAPPIIRRAFRVDIDDSLGRCLLQNGGFEAGLTYWTRFAGTEQVTSTGAYRGRVSLLLSSAESGTQQTRQATPGGIYQLTGYGRSTSSAYSSFGLTFLDKKGSLLSRSNIGSICSSQWRDYFVVALAPARTAQVQIWTYQDFDHGMTQIDGLSLQQIDPDDMPPTQVSQFFLINGPLASTDRTFVCEV